MPTRVYAIVCFIGGLLIPCLAGAQEAKLLPGDGARADLFGQAVALSGDGQYAIVGAWQHDHPRFLVGSAYVFARSGAAWSEQAELTASDAATGDEFGTTVALSSDGQYALVGAPGDDDRAFLTGSVYVFARDGTTWSQQAKLNASDAQDNDRFGKAVAISADGQVALVGAWLDEDNGDDGGSAYVFVRNGTTWSEEAKLLADDGAERDWFGLSVALSADGQYALIAAQQDDDGGADAGSAYVFARDGTTWSQQAKLTATDAAANDAFGHDVAISADGQYAVVGAYWDDDSGADAGSAYVFARTGTTWSQQAKLTASTAAAGDQFGYSVAISGDGTAVLVGANAHDQEGTDAGSAFVYVRQGTTWREAMHLTASDAAPDDFFGRAVALSDDGQYALVGADGDDDNGDDSGSAYVYEGMVATALEDVVLPEAARLTPPAPNPFRQQTTVTLTLARPEPVRVALYDLLGREVRVLYDGMLPAQTPRSIAVPSGTLPNGLYWIRVTTPTLAESRQVVLQR